MHDLCNVLTGHLETATTPTRNRKRPWGSTNFTTTSARLTPGSGGPDAPEPPAVCQDATLVTRLRARLHAGRLDRDVDNGVAPVPGSPLAVHMARLTSMSEREALARSLRQALADLHRERPAFSPRVPVHVERLASCEDVIDDITLRLHGPRPVRARGMARLRMLLSDGTGPLYRTGRGSLAAGLRGVLAAL